MLKYYNSAPVWVQNIACTLYGLKERKKRHGKQFYEHLSCLTNSDFNSRDNIVKYQKVKLSNLINYAYNNTDYYKSIFDSINFNVSTNLDLNSFKNIPVLTKDIILNNKSKLLSNGIGNKSAFKVKTSGTTGTALSFPTTINALSFQWAIWWRHRQRFGIKPNTWHVNVTGRPVVPLNQKKPPFWRWDYARKQLLINMQSIRKENINSIINVIDDARFEFYAVPPSMLFALASFIKDSGRSIKYKPKVIFTSAENLLEYQESLLQEVFDCTVTEQYGFTEGCGNASKCRHGYYHEDWEFGVLECENKTFNPDGSYSGNILATGFSNLAFPFIRYRIGDVGTWMPDNFVCPCRRESKVLKHIDGRIEDFVITPEGNKIMRFGYLFQDSDGVKEAQVIQYELGSILIRIVPRASYSKRDERIIKRSEERRVG